MNTQAPEDDPAASSPGKISALSSKMKGKTVKAPLELLGQNQLPTGMKLKKNPRQIKVRKVFRKHCDQGGAVLGDAHKARENTEKELKGHLCKWVEADMQWAEMSESEKKEWAARQRRDYLKEKGNNFFRSVVEMEFYRAYDELKFTGQKDLQMWPLDPEHDIVGPMKKSVEMFSAYPWTQEMEGLKSMNGGWMINADPETPFWKWHKDHYLKTKADDEEEAGAHDDQYFGPIEMEDYVDSMLTKNKGPLNIEDPTVFDGYFLHSFEGADGKAGPQPAHIDLLNEDEEEPIRLLACICYLSEGENSTILYDANKIPERPNLEDILSGPWADAPEEVKNDIRNFCDEHTDRSDESFKKQIERYASLCWATHDNRLAPKEDVGRGSMFIFNAEHPHCGSAAPPEGTRTVFFCLVGERGEKKKYDERVAAKRQKEEEEDESSKVETKFQMSREKLFRSLFEISQDYQCKSKTRLWILEQALQANVESAFYGARDDTITGGSKNADEYKYWNEYVKAAVAHCTCLWKKLELEEKMKTNQKEMEATLKSMDGQLKSLDACATANILKAEKKKQKKEKDEKKKAEAQLPNPPRAKKTRTAKTP